MSNPAFANKPVKVEVGETEFTFTPTVLDTNNYSNSVGVDNKVAPARTYLERTVAKDQKEALVELLNTVPGLVMELFGTVYNASKGGITIKLKN
ncbi:putative phage tail assembly chaperone [Vibrio vulnificus]|uniref:putative phage tail assembly chaperone n=1 Tax=Vibrio vulnificus TaxID=672 RepID=UPI001F04AA64|nr:putative phage tail assembly chaperone [Vibrio vulnificus]MCG9651478.1 putative phage tail assembly chaperone [Vibrio vulnificus]